MFGYDTAALNNGDVPDNAHTPDANCPGVAFNDDTVGSSTVSRKCRSPAARTAMTGRGSPAALAGDVDGALEVAVFAAELCAHAGSGETPAPCFSRAEGFGSQVNGGGVFNPPLAGSSVTT
ncbi:hypothetical protein GCM10020216_070610 [Nonomuraea helvata]